MLDMDTWGGVHMCVCMCVISDDTRGWEAAWGGFFSASISSVWKAVFHSIDGLDKGPQIFGSLCALHCNFPLASASQMNPPAVLGWYVSRWLWVSRRHEDIRKCVYLAMCWIYMNIYTKGYRLLAIISLYPNTPYLMRGTSFVRMTNRYSTHLVIPYSIHVQDSSIGCEKGKTSSLLKFA